MSKYYTAGMVLVLLLLCALFLHLEQQENQKPLPLSPFSLIDTQGKAQDSQQWQGTVLVINFWATWCPSCLQEIPFFIRLQKKYQAQGVQFIGIAIDNPQAVEEYLDFIDINYPILLAPSEGLQLAQQMGNSVSAIPYTVVVDTQNQIIFRHAGELSEQILDAQLRQVLLQKTKSIQPIPKQKTGIKPAVLSLTAVK